MKLNVHFEKDCVERGVRAPAKRRSSLGSDLAQILLLKEKGTHGSSLLGNHLV